MTETHPFSFYTLTFSMFLKILNIYLLKITLNWYRKENYDTLTI